MGVRLYREYQLKFYLNARHFIIIDGRQGEAHPHTWEYSLNIRIGRNAFTQFRLFEESINSFLARYQNQLVNELEPFGEILPTLENMTDYFAEEFYRIVRSIGGDLIRVESSESPTRSYILNLRDGLRMSWEETDVMAELVDSVLDDIFRKNAE